MVQIVSEKRSLEGGITEEVQAGHGDQKYFHVNRHTQDFQLQVSEL